MSRDLGGGSSSRWDTERFVRERDRERGRGRFEELLQPQRGGGELVPRPRERSVDETYERRVGPGGRIYEDERYKERDYYDEPPQQSSRSRRESVTIQERKREVYSPSPPRRAPAIPRPGIIRRQSSLDTFDRRPLPRYERAYELPQRFRAPSPQRRYARREFEALKVDKDADGTYRVYPERVLERETIRSRRRSLSSETRSRSVSASSSSSSEASVSRAPPKRGKTRIPARLVSIKAIIDLGYPYERDDEVIIIQKALRPHHIDQVMKLSEIYLKSENKKAEMSGARSDYGGEIIEERREIVRDIPAQRGYGEIIEKTTIDRRELMRPPLRHLRSQSVGPAPRIIDASPSGYGERSSRDEVGALVVIGKQRPAEVEERTTLKVEPNRGVEIRKEDIIRRDEIVRRNEIVRKDEIIRRDGRNADLVVIQDTGRDRRRRYSSVDRVEIRRDKKAAQARAISTMMKTLT